MPILQRVLLEAHPELDGLFCYNDLVTVGALQACRELGLTVPDDVAVVGCDDIRLASLVTPALTTLRVDKGALGRRAVALLLERLVGAPGEISLTLKPELVVRASVPQQHHRNGGDKWELLAIKMGKNWGPC